VAAVVSLFPIAKNGISQKAFSLSRQEPALRFLKRGYVKWAEVECHCRFWALPDDYLM